MAKAILEYDLSDPDDLNSHKLAIKSGAMICALWDIDQHLRNKLKYEESLSDDQNKVLEETRERLRGILEEKGISFDDLLL